MSEIKIVTDDRQEEPEKSVEENVKEALSAADEYEKIKLENDKLEAEYNRRLELKSKMALSGKAAAGEPEVSEQEKNKKEAADLIRQFRNY